MMSGIYQIRCVITNKCYIGSSNHVINRLKIHNRDLKKNRHFNKYLQSAYNKYRINNFEYSVLEICDTDNLRNRETYWINAYKTTGVYNLRIVDAYSNLGIPCKTRKLLKKDINNVIANVKKKKSITYIAALHNVCTTTIQQLLNGLTYKDYITEPIPYYNKSLYKLTDNDVINIVNLINDNKTCKSIAKLYNVDKTLIQMIKRGLIWKKYSSCVKPEIRSKKSTEIKIAVYNVQKELLYICNSMLETSTKTRINYNTINSSVRRKTLCNNQFYFEKI